MVMNALKDDKRVEQFINSFTLKEATATVDVDTEPSKPVVIEAPMVTDSQSNTNSKTEPPPASSSARPLLKAPIRGGVLNGKAISLPKPSYPEAARVAGASGTVAVQITINESGDVMTASAVSGDPLLHAAAVAAAYRAKFSPTRLSGQPVKVSGTVTYNFVLR